MFLSILIDKLESLNGKGADTEKAGQSTRLQLKRKLSAYLITIACLVRVPLSVVRRMK